MLLEAEIKKWNRFLEALRFDERRLFEDMMNFCRLYASAAGAAARPVKTESMFMSILLAHQKALKEIQATLDKIKRNLS